VLYEMVMLPMIFVTNLPKRSKFLHFALSFVSS